MTDLVFSPDTLVRFKAGRILIHTTASKLPAFESENPMLVGWLCQFARPLDAQASLSALKPADRPIAAQAVAYLETSGALVDANSAETTPADAAEAASRTKAH